MDGQPIKILLDLYNKKLLDLMKIDLNFINLMEIYSILALAS